MKAAGSATETEGPRPARDGGRSLRGSATVLVGLVGLLATLGVSVAAVAGVAEGVRAATHPVAAPSSVPPGPATVSESMDILTGKLDGHPGWPRYTHTRWTVRAGETVTLRITSYDDGSAPLTGAQTMYDKVDGTLGGTETVDGRPISSVPNSDLAHTFTVVALGLNLPIPAAPTGGSVTFVARFVVGRAGSFVWQCYAPCGSGSNSMGGAMSTMGWMEGLIRVLR